MMPARRQRLAAVWCHPRATRDEPLSWLRGIEAAVSCPTAILRQASRWGHLRPLLGVEDSLGRGPGEGLRPLALEDDDPLTGARVEVCWVIRVETTLEAAAARDEAVAVVPVDALDAR